MVSTRSKREKTLIRLPRFGRVSLYAKIQVEEVTGCQSDDESVNTLEVLSNSKLHSLSSSHEEGTRSTSDISSDSESESDSEDSIYQTPKKTLAVLKDISFSPFTTEAKLITEPEQDNAYEQQRLKRMQENMKVLENLGMSDTLNSYAKSTVHEEAKRKVVNRKRKKQQQRRRILLARAKSKDRKSIKKRTSPRFNPSKKIRYHQKQSPSQSLSNLGFDIEAIAGMVSKGLSKDDLVKRYTKDMLDSDDEDDSDSESEEDLLEEEKKELAFVKSLQDRYYTCEEYFTLKGIKPKFIQEHGKFEGWVEEKLREKIGIAVDKETAWEGNGGGKFTFKTPTGSSKLSKSESAKETARKMLFKNPNSYFYRHTAPGLEHWQGDWTEPENQRFLEVAKKYGVGTKWGLFATYIGHRVGYQCSNYYRSHFIEGGIIWDNNFLLDKYGKSIYVGRKNKYL